MTHTSRSVKRRVKRRASKSVKRKLRPMSKKRMNLRKMRGGKDPNDFFSIYHVTVPITRNTDKHKDGVRLTATKFEDVGILFYNHKTGHFKLFSKKHEPSNGTGIHIVELINRLCGVGKNDMLDYTLDESSWKYYYIFDGNTLWAVKKNESSQGGKQYKIEIRKNPTQQRITKLENKQEQDVNIGDSISSCTIVKLVDDDEAKTNYQGSEGVFTFEDTQLRSYFQKVQEVDRNFAEVWTQTIKKKQEEMDSKKAEAEKKAAEEAAAKAAAKAAAEATPEAVAARAAEAEAEAARNKVWAENAATFWSFDRSYEGDVADGNYALLLLNEAEIEADDYLDSGRMETNQLSKCFENVLLRKTNREVAETDLDLLRSCVNELRWKLLFSAGEIKSRHEIFKDVSKKLNPQLTDSSVPDKIKVIKQGMVYDGDIDRLTPAQELKYKKKMLIIQAYSDADDLKPLVNEQAFENYDAIYDMIARKLEFLLLESKLSPPTFKGTTLSYKNFKKFLYDLLSGTDFIIPKKSS